METGLGQRCLAEHFHFVFLSSIELNFLPSSSEEAIPLHTSSIFPPPYGASTAGPPLCVSKALHRAPLHRVYPRILTSARSAKTWLNWHSPSTANDRWSLVTKECRYALHGGPRAHLRIRRQSRTDIIWSRNDMHILTYYFPGLWREKLSKLRTSRVRRQSINNPHRFSIAHVVAFTLRWKLCRNRIRGHLYGERESGSKKEVKQLDDYAYREIGTSNKNIVFHASRCTSVRGSPVYTDQSAFAQYLSALHRTSDETSCRQ